MGFSPYLAWLCLISSLPLRVLRSLVTTRKTLLLVNLLKTIIIVINKICFANKNILEITNKFIPSNQIIF